MLSRAASGRPVERFTEGVTRRRVRSSLARNSALAAGCLGILAVTTSYADELPDFRTLVEEEGDAVVKITVTTESAAGGQSGFPGFDFDSMPEQFRRFFEQMPQNRDPEPRRGAGFGSGFIMSDDGYVITNAHVVNNATEIRVGLQDRRELEAELIGSDAASDIALLKIESDEELPVVQIGDSDALSVGEWVLAIGSPFGFEHTATQGIVSALSRSLPDDTYVPFIQTDVAVNPGNSGGPLFNTAGEVVGVNSQIYSRSGGYQGLSFAIPINVAMSIADQLRENGYATRGWLGVTIQNVDQALAESFGLSRPEGALVAQVGEGSPAAQAGIEAGDIILEFRGRSVEYSSALPPLVGAVAPGETVPVEIMRAGERQTIEVTIEALPQDRQANAGGSASPMPATEEAARLGLAVDELDGETLEQLEIEHGVRVTEVEPDGPAARAGIRTGDVLISLDRAAVESVDGLREQVEGLSADKPVPVLVQRDDRPLFLALELSGDS